jgi:formimidoylglutamate deiminase
LSTVDTTPLWAPRAWIDGAWHDAVLLRAGADGCWAEISPGTPAPPHATVLPGPVLPGLVDAHSHAFQRAFAGLAERRSGAHDDFWSWRDRMYGVALRITPDELRAVATQLYTELLCGGYTQVCEFHYLHHAPDGAPYADPLAMSRALADAAADAGIGLTLLPVLYERAGFAQPALRDDQRRFKTDVDAVLRLRDGARAWKLPHVTAGVAVHSLRAASATSIQALVRRVEGDAGPIHIHVAEQSSEVADCLAATGARPIEWLAREVVLDERWQLVHATHATPTEIEAVGRTGAGVVLCPTTEANLGDGLADLPGWLASGAALSLGSDSQVARAWPEEMRWLEYGQRLQRQQRNVAAGPDGGVESTAAHLLQRTLAGGAVAAGFKRWGLEAGARADLLVLDIAAPGLLGVPASHTLDALVFATDAPSFSQVWVAGRQVAAAGDSPSRGETSQHFLQTMRSLWRPAPD